MLKKSVPSTPKLKIKKNKKIIEYSPTQELLDEALIRDAVWECLTKNDTDGVMQVLDAHLEAINKELISQKNSIARSTLYHSLREKNPTLKTLAKLVSAVHAKFN